MSEMSKAVLRRVGNAALSGLSDREIRADPARAMLVAQSAMRAVLRAIHNDHPRVES